MIKQENNQHEIKKCYCGNPFVVREDSKILKCNVCLYNEFHNGKKEGKGNTKRPGATEHGGGSEEHIQNGVDGDQT